MVVTYTSFLNPNDSRDRQIIAANICVQEWMKDSDNRTLLHELKQEALHSKGNSVAGNMKHKHVIPQDAYILLPEDIRSNKKLTDKWVKTYHPYLFISK